MDIPTLRTLPCRSPPWAFCGLGFLGWPFGSLLGPSGVACERGLSGSVVLELVHLLGAPTGRHLHCVGALCWAIQTNGNVFFMDVLYLSLVYVFGGHIVGLDATNGVQHSTF